MSASAPMTEPSTRSRPSVLIVDDSAVVRGLVARWVEEDDRFTLAATCPDGEQGVKRAGELQPDLVVLDVEMPRMDGLTALPLILQAAPRARVVMASTLTSKGAQVTFRAMALGAADYAPKPEAGRVGGADAYRRELLDKLFALGRGRFAPARAPAQAAPRPVASVSAGPVSLIAIGSSTGGPEALRKVISGLAAHARTPIVISQHMPKVFTAILAEHISKTGLPAKEAEDGEVLLAGRVYVAPGEHHLTVIGEPGAFRARLDQSPPVNFCRPAVDPLFESCAKAAGGGLLAVVLTGMGHDGREGARAARAAGARVIAQDQATSVVWGMPGAVAEAGLADMILPVEDIGPEIVRRLKGAV